MLRRKNGNIAIRTYYPVFDSWWRFIRNLKIRDEQINQESGYKGKIPGFIRAMIKSQQKYSEGPAECRDYFQKFLWFFIITGYTRK